MDIYDSRYFIVNKKLLTSFGLWPYQNYKRKLFIRTLLTAVMCCTLAPQILRVYLYLGDIDIVIEHVAIVIFMLSVFLKLFTAMVHEKKLDVLYRNIAKNWEIIQDPTERKILTDYSERGRILTIGYVDILRLYWRLRINPFTFILAYVLAACIIFNALPLTPMVLNILRPLNISRPQIFVLGGEFFVDRNKYYVEIFIFDVMCTATSAGIMAAFDSMYGTTVEHSLGLFAIIKFRLRKSEKFDYTDIAQIKKSGDLHQQIIETIRLHRNILIFTDILQSTYSSSFLILLGMNMILMSFECILILIKINQIMELIRYSFIWLGVIIHLFFLSWPGQKLIDFSTSLFHDAYDNKWYASTVKSQKLLAFLSLRSLKPCCLTAGGMYVLNFENFAMILKTSLSYMTLFSSLR